MTPAGLTAEDPEASGRLLFLAALLAGLLLRLVSLGAPDLLGTDEGSWAVGARNIVEGGLPQFFAPASTPLGEASGTPVFFPALLAVGVKVFGPYEWALRLPSVFAGLLGALVLERIVRRGYGQPAGHLAGAFAALAPPLVAASRVASVEPTLTALGLGGIIFGLRAFEEDSLAEAPLSGFLFGLGFLAKGTAVFLFILPLAAALALRPRLFSLGRTKKSTVLLLGSFLLTAGLQLLVTAIVSPGAVAPQVHRALASAPEALRRLAVGGVITTEVRVIVRTLFFLLPLGGLGIGFLSRGIVDAEIASGATGGERRLSHGALWVVYGVELLYLVAVSGRLQLSSTPVLPALSAFLGLGAAALLARPRSPLRVRLETTTAVVSGVVVLAGALLLIDHGGGEAPGLLPRWGPVASIVLCTAAAAVLVSGALAARTRYAGPVTFAFLGTLLVSEAVGAARFIEEALLRHRTGLRAVAQQVAPAVARLDPRDVAFRSPEPEVLEFHLFRTGRSWADVRSVAAVAAEARKGHVAFWVYRSDAPPGASAPPEDVRAWLAAEARDVTSEVDARAGRRTGLRVYLAPAPPPA